MRFSWLPILLSFRYGLPGRAASASRVGRSGCGNRLTEATTVVGTNSPVSRRLRRHWYQVSVRVSERGRSAIRPYGHRPLSAVAKSLPLPIYAYAAAVDRVWLAARGMDTRRLHFLGHAGITATMRYTAILPELFKNIRRYKGIASRLIRPVGPIRPRALKRGVYPRKSEVKTRRKPLRHPQNFFYCRRFAVGGDWGRR
jgi:hypothetical protein